MGKYKPENLLRFGSGDTAVHGFANDGWAVQTSNIWIEKVAKPQFKSGIWSCFVIHNLFMPLCMNQQSRDWAGTLPLCVIQTSKQLARLPWQMNRTHIFQLEDVQILYRKPTLTKLQHLSSLRCASYLDDPIIRSVVHDKYKRDNAHCTASPLSLLILKKLKSLNTWEWENN